VGHDLLFNGAKVIKVLLIEKLS